MNAAVPSTIRARAPAASASRTAVSARRPPPYCTGTPQRRGDALAGARGCRRARPRAVEVDDVQRTRALLDPGARGLERVVVVDRLVVEVAPGEAHGLPAGDVDRGIEDHSRRHPARRRAAKFASSAGRASTTSPGGTARRRAASRVDHATRTARRTSLDAQHVARPAGTRRERVHVVEGRAVAAGPRSARDGARRSATRFQPMCGSFRPPASSCRDAAGQQPEARRRRPAPPSSSNSSCMPRHDAEQRHARVDALAQQLVEAELAQVAPSRAGTRRRRARRAPSAARSSSWSRVIDRRARRRAASAFSTERRLPIP